MRRANQKTLDPFEIAYLRGGDAEAFKLHLFDLVQRGYLQVIENRKWVWTERRLASAEDPPSYESLTEWELTVCGWFRAPLTQAEIETLRARQPVPSSFLEYQVDLEVEGFLRPEQGKGIRFGILVAIWVGSVVLIRAHWGLLAFLLFVGASVSSNYFLSRVTSKGRQRLKALREQFDGLKDYPKRARLDVPDPLLVAAVAIFGTSVLAGSVYDAFGRVAGSTSNDGGCGGGCGGCGCGGCGGCG